MRVAHPKYKTCWVIFLDVKVTTVPSPFPLWLSCTYRLEDDSPAIRACPARLFASPCCCAANLGPRHWDFLALAERYENSAAPFYPYGDCQTILRICTEKKKLAGPKSKHCEQATLESRNTCRMEQSYQVQYQDRSRHESGRISDENKAEANVFELFSVKVPVQDIHLAAPSAFARSRGQSPCTSSARYVQKARKVIPVIRKIGWLQASSCD